MGQRNSNVDPEIANKALNDCDVEALRNILGGLNDPKTYLHTPVGNSTRLPIEIVIYSYAGPEKVVATLKLLLEYGLDVNFVKKNTPHPPFSLIAINSPPMVIKFLLEKGMKFDGEATYPAEGWCNHQVAHLLHKTPEPCSGNNFEQKEYPNGYDHNNAKLKLDLFNFIKDETRNNFVRLMEKRVIKQYNAVKGEVPEYNLLMELPTLDDKKIPCHIQYKSQITNNGSENFTLSVKLPKSLNNADDQLTFSAKHRVNAYDGCDTRPFTTNEGSSNMAEAVKEYFGIPTIDFYGFLLLLVLHIECGTLMTATSRRKIVLTPPILRSVTLPTWYKQVVADWARAAGQEEEENNSGGDNYEE